MLHMMLLSLMILQAEDRAPTPDRDAWSRLAPGMTAQQVQRTLGEPLDQETARSAAIWYYIQAPTRENDRVVDRPEQGLVRFKLLDRDPATGRRFRPPILAVHDWTEPDWTQLPPEPEPQAPADSAPVQTDWRQHAQARQQAYEQRLRQAAQRTAQSQSQPQQSAAPAAQPAPPPQRSSGLPLVTKYFMIIGGSMIAAGLILGILLGRIRS